MRRIRFVARAARYPETVSVYQDTPTTAEAGDGQPIENASLYCSRRAKVILVTSAGSMTENLETYRSDARQVQADETYLVRLRYDETTKAITPQMWVVLSDGRRLNIAGAANVDFDRREIELKCKERV